MIAVLDVGSLDGGPGSAVGDFFLPDVTGVRREGVVEGGAIDVLRMGRKVVADRCRKIGIGAVRHLFLTRLQRTKTLWTSASSLGLSEINGSKVGDAVVLFFDTVTETG